MRMIKGEKGIILIAGYMVIAALLIISTVFVGRSTNEKNLAIRNRSSAYAMDLSEAGLDRGLVWLRDQSAPPTGTALFYPIGQTPQALEKGTYLISIDPDDTNPGSSVKRYKIISIGTVDGVSRQLINVVQTDSYARFAFFTDTEHFRWFGWFRVPVWFAAGDNIEGPTQTNSHFHIQGNPVFEGMVNSVDDYLTFFNNGSYLDTTETSNPPYDTPDFQEGINLGYLPLDMPSKALDLRTASVQGGLKLTGATTVVLNSDGTMNVTNSHQKWVDENMPLPANGAFFVDGGDLTVSGTLNGQLTMGTNRDLIVADNVLYADDPRENPNSDDMLGLIAEKDVVISDNAPYNVEVDASVMALGNSFIVEDWWDGPAKGTLTTYGGIIQRERGPVGTFSSQTGQKLTGYSKDYHYDPRLINSPPPFYPTTGDYINLAWKEGS